MVFYSLICVEFILENQSAVQNSHLKKKSTNNRTRLAPYNPYGPKKERGQYVGRGVCYWGVNCWRVVMVS